MALTPEQIAALLRPEGTGLPAAPTALPDARTLNPLESMPQRKEEVIPPPPSTKLQAPEESLKSFFAPPPSGQVDVGQFRLPEQVIEGVKPPPEPTAAPTTPAGPSPVQQSTRTSISYQGPSNPGKYAALEKQGDQLFKDKGAAELDKMGVLAEMQAVAAAKDEHEQLQFQQDYENARQGLAALTAKRDQMMDALNQAEVDPQRYFKSQSAMQQAMLGASLAMGYVVQAGFRLDHNPVMKTLESALERDLRAQEAQLTARSNALSAAGRATEQSQESMRLMGIMNSTKRQHYWDMMGRKLTAEAEKRQIPIESKNMQILLNEIEKRRLQAQMQADAQSRQLLLNRAEAEKKRRTEMWEKMIAPMMGAGHVPGVNPALLAQAGMEFANGQDGAALAASAGIPWTPKKSEGGENTAFSIPMLDGSYKQVSMGKGLQNEINKGLAGAHSLAGLVDKLAEARKRGVTSWSDPNIAGLRTSIATAYSHANHLGAMDKGMQAVGEILTDKSFRMNDAEYRQYLKDAIVDPAFQNAYMAAAAASNDPSVSYEAQTAQQFRSAAKKAGQ